MNKDKIVIGCRIKAFNESTQLSIKRNSKIPFVLRSFIKCTIINTDPYTVEIKLKPKLTKNKIALKSSSELIHTIEIELMKDGLDKQIDYDIEVIYLE